MLEQPMDRARLVTGVGLTFERPHVGDGRAMWELAGATDLDVNSPYAYVMWAEYHADTTVVAMEGSAQRRDLAGFVLGFRVPAAPDTVFVWQIAVAEPWRGRGLASRLLDELVNRTGAAQIEATVVPSNAASAGMFRALAARHGTTTVEAPVFDAALFPDGHEPEVRFRIPTRARRFDHHPL